MHARLSLCAKGLCLGGMHTSWADRPTYMSAALQYNVAHLRRWQTVHNCMSAPINPKWEDVKALRNAFRYAKKYQASRHVQWNDRWTGKKHAHPYLRSKKTDAKNKIIACNAAELLAVLFEVLEAKLQISRGLPAGGAQFVPSKTEPCRPLTTDHPSEHRALRQHVRPVTVVFHPQAQHLVHAPAMDEPQTVGISAA